MSLLQALAVTFHVTQFDIIFFMILITIMMTMYYFLSIHRIYEAAFGAVVGLGIYILLSVLLVGNPHLGTQGGLFPFGFSVFIVSASIYLVFILAVLFPIHGGLVISEPTHPLLYVIQYMFVSLALLFTMSCAIIYSIEGTYVFRVGNIFQYFADSPYYLNTIKRSWMYMYAIVHQDTIIPLMTVLLIYKILLSNLVTAAVLSIWYNLSKVGFYRKQEENSYRVEFHEVGGGHGDGGHDDHGGHDDQKHH